MSDEFILRYIPFRMKQLGYSKYHLRYRDLAIAAGETITIAAYKDLFFITQNPQDVRIESDYGIYDTTGESIAENTYQHKGEILITNPTDSIKRIKFIQVIIIR